MDRANNKHYRVAYSQSTPKLGLISIEQLLKTPIYASHGWQQTEASTREAEIYQTIFMLYSFLYCNIMQAGLLLINYQTHTIITRSLYILNPLFEGQKRFFKEFFSEEYAFMYG